MSHHYYMKKAFKSFKTSKLFRKLLEGQEVCDAKEIYYRYVGQKILLISPKVQTEGFNTEMYQVDKHRLILKYRLLYIIYYLYYVKRLS